MAPGNPAVHLGRPRFTTAEFGGFLVTDLSFPAGLTLAAHEHDRTVLAVTLRGRWDSVIGGRRAESTPGSVLTEPAGDRHSNRFADSGARILIVQPDVARARELFPHDRLLDDVHHFPCAETTALARRLQIEVNHRDAVSPIAIEGLSLEILASASRAHGRIGIERGAASVKRAVEYVHAHCLRAPTVKDVADAAGVHPAHLARGFRREMGVSLARYLRQLRIQWAAEQLASTTLPIAEIATAAGFVDQSHFSRQFRQRLNASPAEFRRRSAERRRPRS